MATVQYDTKTGKKLSSGETTTQDGVTYTAGDAWGGGSSDFPIRNDLAANGGAGYNYLASVYNPGQINPDSYLATNTQSKTTNFSSNPSGSSVPNSNIVNSPGLLMGNSKWEVPTIEQKDYSYAIPGAISNDANATDTYLKNQEDSYSAMLKDLMNNEPPSSADAYNKAQKQSGILKAQQQVSALTGQLNQIVNQGQANQLSVVGQGRGIPEAILGGQQAQFARETAIQALPVQAQLSAAQGNLEMAQQNLDTLFKIYSDDAKAQYDYRTGIIKSVYDFASGQEKTKLEYALKLEDRAYDEQQALVKTANDYANIAISNNQGSLAAKISGLQPGSPTYREDLAKLTSQIYDPAKALDIELKNLQIKNEKAKGSAGAEAPTIKSINGVDMQWDGTKWIKALTDTSGSNKIVDNLLFNEKITETNKMLGLKNGEMIVKDSDGNYKVQDVNGNLKEIPGGKGLAGTTGTTAIGRAALDFDVITGVRGNFIANINQLTNQATIDNLIAVKKAGGTFGALSEKELALLEQSASKIASFAIHKNDDPSKPVIGYKTTDKIMAQEIAKLQMHIRAFQEADTGSRYTEAEMPYAADNYIINEVGNAIQTSGGGIYGNYQ